MGKRIDELTGLDDTPFDDAPDPRPTDWYRFVADIDSLLNTGDYSWAEGTLLGIQQTVERTQQVSAAQRQAVANIELGAHKRRDGARGRRYEGWGRR